MLNAIINKEQLMTGSTKAAQFLHENVSWKLLLDFFIRENSFLKTRLSEVVDRETDNLFIATAEQFQNNFILKDEYILDIANDIKGQELNLQLAITKKTIPDYATCKLQEKLRNEMSNLEKEFSILKNQFNTYCGQ
ncbi:MAG: hypothetical protein H7Z13_21090 [Ferruginibacter sp.]|nr:hypothetical protein [Ferruginibacter sp.]